MHDIRIRAVHGAALILVFTDAKHVDPEGRLLDTGAR